MLVKSSCRCAATLYKAALCRLVLTPCGPVQGFAELASTKDEAITVAELVRLEQVLLASLQYHLKVSTSPLPPLHPPSTPAAAATLAAGSKEVWANR